MSIWNFLSAMSRACASVDLNQLFWFFKLGCLSSFWFCLSQFCFLVIAVFWYIRENITSTKFSLILLSFELRNAFPGNNFSIFTVTNQDMLVPNLYPQPNVIGTVQGTQWVHSMPSSTYMYPVCITAVQWSYKKIHVRGRRESLAAERRGCLHVCCMCEWAVQNTMDRSSSLVQNSFTFGSKFFHVKRFPHLGRHSKTE